jgi:protein TonB
MGVRATSMIASAAVLGALTIAALSASWVTQHFEIFPDSRPITMETPPLPPTPPQAPRELPRAPADPLPSDVPMEIEALAPSAEASSESGLVSYDPGPVLVTSPHWLRRPSGLEIYYPRRAMTRNMEGQVVLECLVNTSGALGCAVVSETPANWGFGEAALRISRDYRMSPAMRDGMPVEGRYRMVVPFRLD